MLSRHSVLACVLGIGFAGAAFAAGDLDKAPPAFGYRDQMVVPVDIESVHVDYTYDVTQSVAKGKATVIFHAAQGGMPMFDLVPDVTAATLNGNELALADVLLLDDPARVTKLRALKTPVAANSTNELVLEYALSASDVTFSNGTVRVGFFMDDLGAGGRGYFEQFGPANFEFDQTHFTFDVEVVGATAEHEIFTNGASTSVARNRWHVDFPSYFTSSSLYFHLADKGRFSSQTYTYHGMNGDIPVTVYSSSSGTVTSGVSGSQRILTELEGTYGPTAHARFVIYLAGSGGMEHCGATMTSLSAMGHELTHSWFARGVMPQDGNSGWIDEAVASWRDDGYPRASAAPNRSPVNLGGFSVYRRHTSMDAYTLGSRLISELDYLFRDQGGMKTVLKELYAQAKRTTISNAYFQSFMETETGMSLQATFDRYVFGRSINGKVVPEGPQYFGQSHHPRPYTKAELELYR